MSEVNKNAALPEKKQDPRHGEIATIHFISNAKSGPMFVNHGDDLSVMGSISSFRLKKKDGRAYLIPMCQVAFIRFEPGSIPESVEENEDGPETA